MKPIPQEVKNAAKSLVDIYGEQFSFVGLYKNLSVYRFDFPKDEYTGYPQLYLYNKQEFGVEEVTGLEALDILDIIL